ncbi:MAG TPA: polysaccharide deacetylase family protein, partial [Candidatus Saccharimonadales bacterium]|nr:polysaccharide deacetylase family protein [Candidatus Saccharimonadales bacterium]
MRLITNFKAKLIASVLALGMIGSLIVPVVTHAAVVNPAPTAKVSFAFDDSLASAYTKAAPTLAKYGLTGTSYAITGCVGMTKVPNTCHANTDLPYMTWAQLKALQTTYHWEIGSHTVDHPCLASNAKADPSDCQTNTLTKAQVDAELLNSKTALANHGITATAFAPPYGDYSNMVMAQIAKYYTSMRGFKEQGTNGWPLDDYLLNNITVQQRLTPVATLESKIDQAISSNSWVILSFHDIAAKPSQNPDDYQYGTAELAQVAAYVQSKQAAGLIKNVNTSQGLVTSTTNMLPNGTFNDGVGDGWSTDDPIRITKDTASNGSYPDYTNSIKLVSNPNGKQTHLFSPAVSVNPNTTYLFKNFLNVQKISSGEVGFYVDEYDVNGSWISGQYLKRENSSFVEDMNFAYKPTSLAVAKASLQVVMAGTGITAYLDNSQMFALSTATPTQINLLPNGNFNAGIADGWSTDAAGNIVAD